jgi:hypothetical protein
VSAVTAKVYVSSVDKPGGAGPGSTTVTFGPDYADGRNAEWAVATPALSLTMTVQDKVAEKHFAQGTRMTLTFDPEETE